jgi:hypothetical protein
MHNDDIEWADRMEAWKRDPANKKHSRPGDDRTPPFRWLGSLYHDGEHICLPQENLMASLMGGGGLVLTGAKGGKTFKAQTQSGCLAEDRYLAFRVKGRAVPVKPFFDDMQKKSFDEYQELAAQHGFSLFVKRARVGQSKHVRVRPMFVDWSVSGALIVNDDTITRDVLQQILTQAGLYKGLCEWRPGGKTPGPFGTFTAEVE